jgi:hypothetical protein
MVPLKSFYQFGIEQASVTKALAKLNECNDTMMDNKLNTDQIAALEELMTNMNIVSIRDVHISALDTGLRWPIHMLVPILDVFRIALLHVKLNEYFSSHQTIQQLENLLISDSSDPIKILVCRSFANIVTQPHGQQLMLNEIGDILRCLIPYVVHHKSPVQVNNDY